MLCVFVGALGLFMMVMSGMDLLEGDLTSTGSSMRTGWITPPIAFVIGLGLAVSPYFIIRQERSSGSTRSTESWGSVLGLYPAGMALQHGPREGGHARAHGAAAVPGAVPEDRGELGTEAAVRRAHTGR